MTTDDRDVTAPQRLAVAADAPRINALMRASVLALFPRYYSAEQTASATVHVARLDPELVDDGTYLVHEVAGEIVACGGWSRRAKVYAGPGPSTDDSRLLDPAREPARVRAMFVRHDWTRRGLGRAILAASEQAARRAGFRDLTLVATLPGVPLYTAYGFREVRPVRFSMPGGEELACVEMGKPVSGVEPIGMV
ncbi:GNAT family N-acetyltransferase [Pseudonocardia sp. KRD-184]|uniref:GNAT family N-acetyltransferase n=1 Tax=Pseudonocardia oceani TaxID=2792013 RepID=A0ABS6UC57_9PSEU|nr:GNAT family N-acetyltransferase [Pseudonocardia oceani]MBW0091334.1 GNAT family N-acetyltransferase [Pseudonocardia oceani]MBW0098000.1 GNAT family N-acetyltransferase [Pseudonocardia oceani]MBW0110547.1 GNAT family N-acetyltransferase [Pseudonocardia oceani]MBW0124626.1 GNAT family N-acetyltransferase [Pseudonocardia oceani]MBW0129568.1 GNAT family N-acetyltransferase [Pseudonocardia oceani]